MVWQEGNKQAPIKGTMAQYLLILSDKKSPVSKTNKGVIMLKVAAYLALTSPKLSHPSPKLSHPISDAPNSYNPSTQPCGMETG
jgi:hypothetical protein